MGQQVSHRVQVMIENGISALEVPAAIRDSIEWEAVAAPVVTPGSSGVSLGYMIVICVPVPGTVSLENPSGDWALGLGRQPLDPYGPPGDYDLAVRRLYEVAQADADRMQREAAARANGGGRLIIP